MRFVLDTNVLIDGIQDDFSASKKLIEAVQNNEAEALVTHPIVREYNLLVNRRISDPVYKDSIQDFLRNTTEVEAGTVDVVIDDEEDIKFLRAAAGGEADVLVTNDRHLLDIGEIGSTRIVTPAEAWRQLEEETGGKSQWNQFIKGLGIGS